MLAEHLDRVLDEVLRRSSGAVDVPPAIVQGPRIDPLDAPITEEFRVGTMTIAWDPSIDRIVIELFSNVDVDDEQTEADGPRRCRPRRADEIDADEVFVVKITASYAGTSSPGRRPWSPAVALLARSACSRSTPVGTSARGRTGTAVHCSAEPSAAASTRRSVDPSRADRPAGAVSSPSPVACSRPPTPPSWPTRRRRRTGRVRLQANRGRTAALGLPAPHPGYSAR